MDRLYVIGGRQRSGTDVEQVPEWHHYGSAVIATVDLRSGVRTLAVEYESPPDTCPDDQPSFVFKTGSLVGSTLHVCTQTELLAYAVPAFERVGYLSLPCFNDLHHVAPGPGDTLLVANTGLDMVLEVRADGAIQREWSVTDEALWTRFARDVDYRKVSTTKPHTSHPNHVFRLDDDVWVTRCNQGDAICLTGPGRIEEISERPIHDGLLRNGALYFTSVDGHVVVADPASQKVDRRFDLNAIAGRTHPLGWCRGIEVLDERHVAVGFSRLRATRWKQNVRWLKDRLQSGESRRPLPTRVIIFDLVSEAVVSEHDVESRGVNAIFSLHVAPDA